MLEIKIKTVTEMRINSDKLVIRLINELKNGLMKII